jgi:hypothetical protein
MKNSKWVRLLAYVTGSVNQELLLQHSPGPNWKEWHTQMRIDGCCFNRNVSAALRRARPSPKVSFAVSQKSGSGKLTVKYPYRKACQS